MKSKVRKLVSRVAPDILVEAYVRRTSEARRLKKFEALHGAPLDRKAPRTYSAKLNARILSEHDALYSLYGNKLSAPLYAASLTDRALHLPERLGVWRRVTAADLAKLPKAFALKGSHGSGVNALVYDRDAEDLGALAEKMNHACQRVRDPKGRRYDAVLIAEELLEAESGEAPPDYKFHCFHRSDGFDWFLQLDSSREGNHSQDLFDADHQPLPFSFLHTQKSPTPPALPHHLDEMAAIARDLSADFDYVRIDLYSIGERIYFGEYTQFHRSGYSPIVPPEWEQRIGDLWEYRPGGFCAP